MISCKTIPAGSTDGPAQAEYIPERREGWISDSLVQSIVSGPDTETVRNNARARMVFLLLIDDHDLNRDDLTAAAEIAETTSFREFGTEKTYVLNSEKGSSLLLQRTGSDLRSRWSDLRDKIHSNYPAIRSRYRP